MYRVPTTLLVLSFDQAVARWAAKRRSLGPNLTFQALVVGPDDLPTITSVEDALERRDLGVLTALVRLAARRGVERRKDEVAKVFEAWLHNLGDPLRNLYLELMRGVSRGEMRAMLEKLSEDDDMGALEMIRAELKAEGRAEGRAEGAAHLLLQLFTARGLAVDDATRERVLATGDLGELERWAVRCLTATKIEQVFET
jgi:hypothetical protein